MKTHQLIARFQEYVSAAKRPLATPGEPFAHLFGEEAFKVDIPGSRIKIQSPGLPDTWMRTGPLPSSAQLKIDWIAMVEGEEGWSLVIGSGNPYEAPYNPGLPIKEGSVMAAPAALARK